MKAILEFDLPEENVEFGEAVNGGKFVSILHSLDTQLRNYVKYGHDLKSATDAFEHVREIIHNELEEEHLSIWE